MKTIYNKYDKNKINALPQVLFPGKIVVVQSESEADKAVDYLLSCDIMGVDTETKPSFKKRTYAQGGPPSGIYARGLLLVPS